MTMITRIGAILNNSKKFTVNKSRKAYQFTASKSKELFKSVKDSKVGQGTSKVYNSVTESTKSLISKPEVKKGLKYGGMGLLGIGAALGLFYLGKKVYEKFLMPKTHDVKEGDNVWNIAKKDLGSKATNAQIAKRTEELMKLNNLEYANDKGLVIIKPGEKIRLA